MSEQVPVPEGGPTVQDRQVDATPRWRRPVAIACIALGALAMFLGSLTLWVKRQVLDTGQWTTASSALLRDDEVRHQLSVYLVDQAFAKVDVAADLEGRLPPALRPLAGQLAASLRTGAVNVADGILARPVVLRTWELANRGAHESLLAAVDDERSDAGGNVVIDLRPLVVELTTALGIQREPPPNAGRLVVVRAEKIDGVRNGVRAIRGATLLTWVVALALLGAGVWLAAGWRRSAFLMVGWAMTIVGLALLVTRRLAGRVAVDQLADRTQVRGSVSATWEIATTLLRDSAQALTTLGILLLVGLWLVGPSRVATRLRRAAAPPLRRLGPAVWGVFALLALVLLLVLPVGSGRRLGGTLVFLALALGTLGLARQRSLRENPAAEAATPVRSEGAGAD